MNFAAIVSGVFAIAKAVPVVAEYIDKFIDFYTDKQIEKHLIRSAFAKFEPNLLPHTILWRKKEAFSDGVSGQHKSWFEIIQDFAEEKY